MEEIFIQLAIILLAAFIAAYVLKLFKQPIIIGYIIAGVIISPFILELGAPHEVVVVFSELGIAFLLFIVGLHLNPKIIKEIGGSALAIGIIQIALTFGLGFVVSSYILGMGTIAASYVGIALAFSSTIIITKLLSDKRQLDSLYGKISVGVLIVQDLVAVAVLMFISSTVGGTSFGYFAMKSLLGGGALIVALFLFGYFVLPKITRSVARSQELLFLFAVCWCFLIAALFVYVGFSLEIGALIAGVVLSVTPYSIEISSKIRPLRDFFLIIFFIILGLNIQVGIIGKIIVPALILSILALVFKPIILMALCALFGYTKRTNFFVGITMAQISEFSLIVLTLGLAMGHIDSVLVSTLTLTGIITIAISTYMISYSSQIYETVPWLAAIFEKKGAKKVKRIKEEYNAILFGYNRIGFSILNSLKRLRKNYLVVDFNPDTIEDLNKMRVPAIYGDMYDVDFLSDLPLDKAEIIVSTIPDFETNELLIQTVRKVNKKAVVILRAHNIDDAIELYKMDADYVLTPHFLGGDYIAEMIGEEKFSKEKYDDERRKHLRMLHARLKLGQKHPEVSED
jgi:Kef-type K+ transport system membrane component KefB